MRRARPSREIEDVREQVLAAALAVVVRDGASALSMRALARDCAMTAPNLYNYFPNKHAIVLTLMLQGFERLGAALAAELATQPDALSRARGAMRAYLAFGLAHRGHYELMFSQATPKHGEFLGTEQEGLSSEEHQVSMRVAAFAEGLIREVATALGVPLAEGDARLALTAVWSLLHGALCLAHGHNLGYLVDDVPAALDALVLRATDEATLRGLVGASLAKGRARARG